MKLLKLLLATMEVAKGFQVLFAARAQSPDQRNTDPQESTQATCSNRRKRR